MLDFLRQKLNRQSSRSNRILTIFSNASRPLTEMFCLFQRAEEPFRIRSPIRLVIRHPLHLPNFVLKRPEKINKNAQRVL